MNTSLRNISLTIFLTSLPLSLQAADLTLNRIFGSDMDVQRDKSVLVRSTAEKGANVNVNFADQAGEATADAEGLWSVVRCSISFTHVKKPQRHKNY